MKKTAFSLIDLVILVIVVAIMSLGLLNVERFEDAAGRQNVTTSRMEAIELALMQYYSIHGRLPAPNKSNKNITDDDFGLNCMQGGDEGNCSKITATGGDASNDKIYFGAIPSRELGLSDRQSFDGWNGKFAYAVIAKLTTTKNDFDNFKTNLTNGVINIVDRDGDQIVAEDTSQIVAYVILSMGPYGRGAYNKGGTSKVLCKTGVKDHTNCVFNGKAFVDAPIKNLKSPRSEDHFYSFVKWKKIDQLISFKIKYNYNIAKNSSLVHYANDSYYIDSMIVDHASLSGMDNNNDLDEDIFFTAYNETCLMVKAKEFCQAIRAKAGENSDKINNLINIFNNNDLACTENLVLKRNGDNFLYVTNITNPGTKIFVNKFQGVLVYMKKYAWRFELDPLFASFDMHGYAGTGKYVNRVIDVRYVASNKTMAAVDEHHLDETDISYAAFPPVITENGPMPMTINYKESAGSTVDTIESLGVDDDVYFKKKLIVDLGEAGSNPNLPDIRPISSNDTMRKAGVIYANIELAAGWSLNFDVGYLRNYLYFINMNVPSDANVRVCSFNARMFATELKKSGLKTYMSDVSSSVNNTEIINSVRSVVCK